MFGWSWTEVSFLGSQVFGQASSESCARGRPRFSPRAPKALLDDTRVTSRRVLGSLGGLVTKLYFQFDF